jgi:hypothetical protein
MKRIIKIIICARNHRRGNVFSQETLAHLFKDLPVNSNPGLSGFSKTDGVSPASLSITFPFNDGSTGNNYYALSRMYIYRLPHNKLRFFCKKELQLENATKIPLRFRWAPWTIVISARGKQPFNSPSN